MVRPISTRKPPARLDEFIRHVVFYAAGGAIRLRPTRGHLARAAWRGQSNPRRNSRRTYGDCDCPICQMMREEIENAESDEAHGHFWNYCPNSCLDRYDPEGSDERWREELDEMKEWQAERRAEREQARDAAPGYSPCRCLVASGRRDVPLDVPAPLAGSRSCITHAGLVDAAMFPLTSATGGPRIGVLRWPRHCR